MEQTTSLLSEEQSIARNNTGGSKDPSPALKQAASPVIIQRAMAMPASLTPSDFTQIQSIAGNKAVGNLLKNHLQAKMEIGKPADSYENQADQAAEQTVEKLQTPATPSSIQGRDHTLHNNPNHLKRQAEQLGNNEQRAAAPELEGSIKDLRAGGKALAKSIREPMENAFGGADFSRVRIHTGSESHILNRSLRSRAFTTGQDVFFKAGEYNPQSRKGQRLIAHELTHVIQQQGNYSPNTGAQPNQTIQRALDMDEHDWDYDHSLFQRKGNPQDQFKADAALWYHTMFTQPGPHHRGARSQKLRQQQELLKRNFLAQAVLGVQAGDQDTGAYQRLQDVAAAPGKLAGNAIPLAALSSHGGRFGYESTDAASGQAFKNWMLTGDAANAEEDTAGLYSRPMTHSQQYQHGRWQEGGSARRGLGMNMAFGGYGHEIRDLKDRPTRVGFEGQARAEQRGRPGHFTDYQLGSALMKHDQQGEAGRFMIGFEGTAPGARNQLGGEHGIVSTVRKMLGGQANDVSLTGQDKARAVGMPSGMGALKADVTPEKMAQLNAASAALATIRGREGGAAMEQGYFKRLLTSTTQEERDAIIAEINAAAAAH